MTQEQSAQHIRHTLDYLNARITPKHPGRRIYIDRATGRLRYSTEWGNVDLEDEQVAFSGSAAEIASLKHLIKRVNHELKLFIFVYGFDALV